MSFILHKRAVLLPLLYLVLGASAALAQGTGTVQGVITENTTNEPLIGVVVQVEGTTLGAYSDYDGSFQINAVPAGAQKLLITYLGYKADTLSITVEANKALILNHKMIEEGVSVGEVEVVAERTVVNSTDLSVISEVRNMRMSATGVSSQQISRSLDNDAAEVAKRIPGITIQDDRFVIIRGLNERYNSVLLNDMLVPSSETDKRAFSFEIIPSHLIDRMIVVKAQAPEYAGDFTGGLVQVFTKNTSDTRRVQIRLGMGYRAGSSLTNNFNTYKGGKTDWLASDDGTRKLPDGFPTTDQLRSNFNLQYTVANQLPNNWNTSNDDAGLDASAGFDYYDAFNIGNLKLRNLTSVSYSQNFTNYEISYGEGVPASSVYDGRRLDKFFQDQQSSVNNRIGVLQNLSLIINDRNKVEFRGIYNQLSKDKTTQRTGFRYINSTSNLEARTSLEFEQKALYAGQIAGSHSFGSEDNASRLKWNVGLGYAERLRPDFRRYAYYDNITDVNPAELVVVGGTSDPSFNGRFSSRALERAWSGGLDFEKHFGKAITVRLGGFVDLKTRDFSARVIGLGTGPSFVSANYDRTQRPETVFDPANFPTDGTGFIYSEITSPLDQFQNGRSNTLAGYAGVEFRLMNGDLMLYPGARFERNEQGLDVIGQKDLVKREKDNLLPSINAQYSFSDRTKLRGAYGISVNRPEIREFAPFSFFNFEFEFVETGNLVLQQATIYSSELKLEFFPTLEEVVAIGVFNKDFNNAIERVRIPNDPTQQRTTYANAQDASVYGVEVEIRKTLSFIGSGIWSKLGLMFNATLAESDVQLDSAVVAVAQQGLNEVEPIVLKNNIVNRPLQGQSNYVVNSGIFYEDKEHGLNINLFYNVFGQRIFIVGDEFQGNINNASVWERPRNVLDLSISKEVSDVLTVKLGVSDILNAPVRFYQDYNGNNKFDEFDATTGQGDNNWYSYKPGQQITFGATFKLLTKAKN